MLNLWQISVRPSETGEFGPGFLFPCPEAVRNCTGGQSLHLSPSSPHLELSYPSNQCDLHLSPGANPVVALARLPGLSWPGLLQSCGRSLLPAPAPPSPLALPSAWSPFCFLGRVVGQAAPGFPSHHCPGSS